MSQHKAHNRPVTTSHTMAPHNDTTLAALPGETGESCAIEERHSGESCAIEERHSVAHRPEQVIEPAVVHAKRQLILLELFA
mmetsp:Transcript_65497/g.195830  ORF Transcript_65497/g.195830 Transcript_65497/m.195830 type:complete len:82 (+) Transcript_65497:112-357(+)